MPERPSPKSEPAVWAELARHAHLGIQLALSTGLFLLGGWWLDGKLDTAPLLTIVGAMLGAAAGFYSMIQSLKAKTGRSASDPTDQREGEG